MYDPGEIVRRNPVQRRRATLTFLILFAAAGSGQAQSTPPSATAPSDTTAVGSESSTAASDSFVERVQALDRRLFRDIYAIDNRAFRSFVFISDATAYRAFYGSVPAALVYSSLDGNGDWSDVYRLALSEAVTLGATLQLQKVFERDRPPHELAGVGVRTRSSVNASVEENTYSFPSGHASTAAALAMSWSLSYPEWYVIVPGALWASSVAVSRVWRGRHFPGDVIAGIVLGAAVATTIHLLDPVITPGFLKSDDSDTSPSVRFAIAVPIP